MKLFQHIIFSIIALTAFTAQAQPTPPTALFTVTPGNKICLTAPPSSIQVTNATTDPDNQVNGGITYRFGDGSSSSSNPNPTHTYSRIATFNLEQIVPIKGKVFDPVIGDSVGYVSHTEQITVVPNTPLSATYKVCNGGKIKIYITDDRFDSYEVNFGDGLGLVTLPHDPSNTTTSEYTYTTISTYDIIIKGKFTAGNSCPGTDFTLPSVKPLGSIPKPDVVFMETKTEDPLHGTLAVQLIKNATFDYSWDFKQSGSAYENDKGTILHGSGNTTLTLDNSNTGHTLNTKANSYCIRMVTQTACDARAVFSDEICSITNFAATAGDLQNDLTWDAYAGPNINAIEIERENNTPVNLGGAATSYNDNSVVCGMDYCYRVKALLNTSSSLGQQQYSLGIRKCVTATSLAPRPPLTNVNSTINGSDILVTFNAPGGGFTAKSYNLLETVNGVPAGQAASNNGSSTSFTLHGRNTTENAYCYQVNYKDLCNISPAAVTTCPIKLQVTLAEDGTVSVSWTSYIGSSPVSSYTVKVRDEKGTDIKTIPGISGNSITDVLSNIDGQLYYTVITDNNVSSSAPVELQLSPAIYVPDAFSPNNDSFNDFFELKGRFIQSIDLSVFNRWGEPVFHSTDMKNQWDGKVNGGDAPVGTYAYTLDITGRQGEIIKKRGTITLIR